jgi:4-hydroxy-3-polyprenylbenzoate decarboxylase
VIVSTKPRFPGHAQKVMYGMWGMGLMMLVKCVVVVDSDVNVHDPRAAADAVLENVDWRRDVTVVDGPVDQLDHSAIRDSYGGKIGIDATRKPDRAPYPIAGKLPADQITAVVGESWHSPLGGVIVVTTEKTQRPVRALFDAIWAIAPEVSILALDPFVDVRNLSEVAWRMFGNVDWQHDIVIRGGPVDHFAGDDSPRGQVGIDATEKSPEDGHPRGWPTEIVMSEDIRRLVDQKWAQYGIG